MTKTVDVEIANAIAVVTLQRPASLNACNGTLRRELLQAVQQLNADDSVRVVIVTGAGRGFCCGADLVDNNPPEQTVEDRLNQEYKPILLGISEAPKPYIAAVNGPAAGIGCALALSCDIVLMAPASYLFLAFSAIGLLPDGGMSRHLLRQLGPKKAYEVMALGQKLQAQECVSLGLANAVCARAGDDQNASDQAVLNRQLLSDAHDYADRLLTRAPLSLRYTKQVIREVAEKSLDETISIEAGLQAIAYQSDDHAEGKQAFLEKRSPVWKGR